MNQMLNFCVKVDSNPKSGLIWCSFCRRRMSNFCEVNASGSGSIPVEFEPCRWKVVYACFFNVSWQVGEFWEHMGGNGDHSEIHSAVWLKTIVLDTNGAPAYLMNKSIFNCPITTRSLISRLNRANQVNCIPFLKMEWTIRMKIWTNRRRGKYLKFYMNNQQSTASLPLIITFAFLVRSTT